MSLLMAAVKILKINVSRCSWQPSTYSKLMNVAAHDSHQHTQNLMNVAAHDSPQHTQN